MLQFLKGDATQPQGDSPRIITHCVNDAGLWGSGFVVSLTKSWPFSEEAYRHWAAGKDQPAEWLDRVEASGPFGLGEVQLVSVAPNLWVANLVGQHGIGMGPGNRPPVRYEAIQKGFVKLARLAKIHEASIHMPRMGAGLAGGHWAAVENFVRAELVLKGVPVTVYDL